MNNVVPAGWSRCGNKGVISHAYDGNVKKQDRFHICVCFCVLVSGRFFHLNVPLCVCLWNCDGIKKPLESVCVCMSTCVLICRGICV